jgi:hypothetical protein
LEDRYELGIEEHEMRSWTWGIALSLTMAGAAAAQPGPPQPPPTGPVGPPLAPVPEPTPPPAPVPISVPATIPEQPHVETGRPAGLAIGIGIGYVFPTSLQTPNTTSVRLRLASGLTFEPQLVFAASSTDVDTGTTMTTKQNEVTLGSLVRYPLKVQHKIDLELIGSAAISNRVVNPEGDSNNRTTTSLGVGYGVALAYWLSPHWNLSFTASNPLVSYTRTRQETAADVVTVNKSTTVGLVFEPQVALMMHLYN